MTADDKRVRAERLTAAMEAHGFRRIGGRAGQYVRLGWPGPDGHGEASLTVPLDPSKADFDDLLAEVWLELTYAAARGAVAAAVMEAVGGDYGR